MIMDAKTHISNPPPGGGWVATMEDGESLKPPNHSVPAPGERSPNRQLRTNPAMAVPDGGWGWVIVFANFLITFTITSVNTSFGVVYLQLVRSGYTNTQVAAIPAIVTGVSNILTPLSTGLSRFYSHRILSVIGVLLLSLGLLLSSLYNNIVWFYLCYGFISGLGFALVQPMGFLIGQQYFHHKRVIANGLSMLGASMGFMSLPLLISYLMEQYSFQGTLLLWSGIVLHGVLGASLLQPVKWHMKPKKTVEFDGVKAEKNNGQAQQTNDIADAKAGPVKKREDKREFGAEGDNDCMVKQLTPDEEESEDSDQDEVSINPNISLYSDLKSFSSSNPELYSNRQWKNPLTDSLRTNEYLERPRTVSIERSMEILPQIPEEETEDDCFETYDQETGNEKVEFLNRENDVRNRPASYIGARSVDSFNTAPSRESIFNVNDVFDQFGSALSIEIEGWKAKAEAEELKNKGLSRKPPEPCICLGLKCPRFSDLISFSMFRHPVFLISSFSSISNRMAYTCYITYLPAVASNISEGNSAPYLLTCVAFSELLGRILMSVISDRGWIPRRYYCMVASFSAGIAVLILTFVRGLGVLAGCCCWYGFSVGMTMTVGPILLVEYLGMKLLPFTFGLLLFMNGFTAFIVFPVTGLLNDLSGGYHITYRVISILAVIPGILWGMVPCCANNQGANKSPTDNV
ncbi:uncharacterized protein LOC135217312 isoform X2 [Macrobrachium nipponense]|uniref:uncharacterized protein LOC135217312 isoform X2 n=1 Tax=Macrobrachium nipponense TaxID=159736 RepID=UPI0030C806C9